MKEGRAYIMSGEERATTSSYFSPAVSVDPEDLNSSRAPSLDGSKAEEANDIEFEENLLLDIGEDLPSLPENFLQLTKSQTLAGGNQRTETDSGTSVFRSSWCRIACAAHSYQLSVKNCLSISDVSAALSNFRQSMKYFKRSSVAGTYLIRDLKSDNKKLLRPLLDVKTRWGSTAAIIRRFLVLELYITSATDKVFADRVTWTGDGPGDRPPPLERLILETVLEIVKSIDQSSTILGKQSRPTMHLKNICTAGILKKLKYVLNQPGRGTRVHELTSML